MNRFRANPAGEANLIAPPERSDMNVDWKMFRDEVKVLKSAPPLVFNLELLDAARKHSHYMKLNGLGHVEDPGKPGYYGAQPPDRCKLSGYKGFGGAENAFAQSDGPWESHWGFIVDYGPGGPGGMQPNRGHRANMINPSLREVGPGAVPNGSYLSVTHDFGNRDVRFAGGVVYMDLNGNRFYDVGEGLGSMTISSSDGATVSTWKSGAFTLELKGQKEITLTAVYEGEKFSKTFSAGSENIKFDWIVAPQVALKKADRLIEAVIKISDPKSTKYFQSIVSLYMNTRSLYLDDDRRKKVDDLTGDTGKAIEEAQKAVLEILKDGDASALSKVVAEQRKPFRGTEADVWFQDAEFMGRLKRGVANYQKQSAVSRPSAKEKAQFAASLEAEGQKLKTPFFKQELAALVQRVKSM
jgi:hypothetical protein